MRHSSRIVVLTGAGISAESGVPVFRGPDGLWEGRRVEEVATAEAVAFHRDDVNGFFNGLRRNIATIKPNPAHFALAELERELGNNCLVVSQNIDPLHEKAGTKNLIHMHGELFRVRCDSCEGSFPFDGDVHAETPCALCGERGGLRPDVVLFGEIPKQMDNIYSALSRCDCFVAIGTSGFVYPAAGFVDIAHAAGAKTIEINLADTERSLTFEEKITGPASESVRLWVRRVLRESS
jgi:NAD-dependent deacetylase